MKNVQLLTKQYFPKLYQVLCNRDAGEKFKPKSDDNRRALRDANSTLATFSRNCIIGHMSFSDWKTYSSSQAHAPSVHPTKRRKTRGVDEVVTSRFQASDTLDSRSAQVNSCALSILVQVSALCCPTLTFSHWIAALLQCGRVHHAESSIDAHTMHEALHYLR